MNLKATLRAPRRLIPLVAAFPFVVALLLPPGASAAEAPPAPHSVPGAAAGTASGADSAATVCYASPKRGVDAVRVHTQPSTVSTTTGLIYPGHAAVASCTATPGARYTACGGTSTWWIRVTWGGRTGYVAWLCVDWYYPA